MSDAYEDTLNFKKQGAKGEGGGYNENNEDEDDEDAFISVLFNATRSSEPEMDDAAAKVDDLDLAEI